MDQKSGYSGTPLPRKLGIKAGHHLLIVRAPEGFDPQPLPDGVTVHHRAGTGPYDVIVAFAADGATLDREFASLAAKLDRAGALWICWPKKSSALAGDLSDTRVREAGLDLPIGLVDVKVAAIDATWSALKFVYRLAAR